MPLQSLDKSENFAQITQALRRDGADLGTDPVFSPSNDNRRSALVKTGSVPMLDDILPKAPILRVQLGA